MSIDIAGVLEKAADDIAINGLAKGDLVTKDGRHCAVGAIACAMGLELEFKVHGFVDPRDWDNKELKKVLSVVASNVPGKGGPHDWQRGSDWNTVAFWNNAEERTADEVVELMRHVAKDLRNEATP